MTPGSSPLARGLHDLSPGDEWYHRIIPARAGFTGYVYDVNSLYPDHPRSRGVYGLMQYTPAWNEGSSPLARGLPQLLAPGDIIIGIIPARAGFTPRGRACTTTVWDHPRSRGVYAPPAFVGSAFVGSSPLARGLPPISGRTRFPTRIIPARAGFTRPELFPAPLGGDHPRSRGVYS